MTPAGRPVALGLWANAGQFWLLVLVNAFVGGMVGLERTIVPLVGTEEFGLASGVVVFARSMPISAAILLSSSCGRSSSGCSPSSSSSPAWSSGARTS